MEPTQDVNWLAVIVGFVLAFLLGWLWYSPMLFGKKWAQGVGVELGSAKGMPAAPMIFQALGTFLLAWVVGITAALNALALVFLIALTIAVLIAAGGLFTKKSPYAIATESGFAVAMVVLMVAVHAVL